MKDYLPYEAELREKIQQTILSCYGENGFSRIFTPAVEDIVNLDKSEGGENLNLIFRIMKRGDKLEAALKNGGELCDMGLRYDLTLPLSRYYAANRDRLPMPFKCIQTDRVYRAERPQKGRMREFIQCDIDIIGDSSTDCETELITVTADALSRLGIGDFRIRINDRRVLNAVLLSCGFAEDQLESVCVSFDKLDKIGAEGVRKEISEKGFPEQAAESFGALLERLPLTLEEVKEITGAELTENLETIISSASALIKDSCKLEFDLSLVRGQGYYTGTVFEAESCRFRGAVAGGGRYDGLIGKFTGEDIPACGFSIGFERIFGILSENAAADRSKTALVYECDFAKAYGIAEKFRSEGVKVSLFRRPKKMKQFLDRLASGGYAGWCTDSNTEIKYFNGE